MSAGDGTVGADAPAPPPATRFLHAPYASGVRPFSIGLAPLDPGRWLEPDARLGAELAEKEWILDAAGEEAFRAEAGMEGAQAEAADLVLSHVSARFPDTWSIDPDRATVRAGAFRRTLRKADFAGRPLDLAARLVQDDLVLMRRDGPCWRLVAASLAFPSSWSLAEKFGRPMAEIHAAVPGFPGRMAERVDRIFDNLRPGAPVGRLNWSIYPDDRLRHHVSKNRPVYGDAREGRAATDLFVRVERQTLARLPTTGAILFTIRVMVDPVAAIAAHPDGGRLARALADGIAALDPDQLAYKGLSGARDRLVADLLGLASALGA